MNTRSTPARLYRILANLSQDELALRAGVGRADVSRLERGYHVSPRVRLAVAQALNVSVQAFGQDPKEGR